MRIAIILNDEEKEALENISKDVDLCDLVNCEDIECEKCPFNGIADEYRNVLESIRNAIANL